MKSVLFFCLLCGLMLPGNLLGNQRFEVSLITMYPGEGVFTTFGHIAFRIQDREMELDLAFDCGTYDSTDPLLAWKFLVGKLDYHCSRNTYTRMLEWYLKDFDGAKEQYLNLNDAAATRLLMGLLDASAPGRSAYRYHHFFNNCSTRLRDLLDEVLGGALSAQTREQKLDVSFRDLIQASMGRPGLAPARWLVFGLLSGDIDLPLDRWQRMFLPFYLAAELEEINLGGMPLVRETSWIEGASRDFPPKPTFLPTILLLLILAAIQLWPLLLSGRHRPGSFWLLGQSVAAIMVSFYGVVLLIGWFFSPYPEIQNNWNLLFANPLHLVAAALSILAIKRPSVLRYLAAFHLLNICLALLFSLLFFSGFVIQTSMGYAAASMVFSFCALLVLPVRRRK